MSSDFLPFVIFLLFAAALAQGDFVFTVLYLTVGIFILGRGWMRRVTQSLTYERSFERRVFVGEQVPVRLTIRNNSLLPLTWLRVYDGLPVELAAPNLVNSIISLGPRASAHLDYVLFAQKRGAYAIGPARMSTSDLFGLAEEHHCEGAADTLIVYPRILPIDRLSLPSNSPQGILRSQQPLFADPTRIASKRDYTAGDSLRQVDWKASAAVGRLQVKKFEPAISLEAVIFLSLHAGDYPYRSRLDDTELAVVVAASLANWLVAQKQEVGLATNGSDPLQPEKTAHLLPTRKGRGHLMTLLDVLARVQMAETQPLAELLRQQRPALPRGATLLLITGQADDFLFDELLHSRRRGLNPVLALTGRASGVQETRARAEAFGVPFTWVQSEADTGLWRG